MRKTYHFCLSSHDEVMFRSEADLNRGFNTLACAVLFTESRALAEGFLTTHHHSGVQTDYPKELTYRFRNAYSRYFNTKYHRRGRLGERQFFSLEVNGLHHTVAMLNYVIRQCLHHGIASTPFDYPHGSANAFFRKELGKDTPPALLDTSQRYQFLPSNVSLPAGYRMDASGLLLREDILDTAYVEEIYITPRNYLFQMNRLSDERDLIDQQKENDTPPVTLGAIESGVAGFDVRQALICEQGRVNLSRMSDLELCRVIDEQIVPRYFKGSPDATIYDLPRSTRERICEGLWRENDRQGHGRNAAWNSVRPTYPESRDERGSSRTTGFLAGKTVTEQQLRRCLCLNYDAGK